MIRHVTAMFFSLAVVLPGFSAWAADASEEEAKALTIKAASLIAKDGLEKAHDAFLQEGEFKHGEIYVNVIDLQGVWKVYPPKPVGEGKSVLAVQDADGHFLVQEIIKLAKDKGEGWVEYRWQNPATKRIQAKTTYVMRVPGADLITYVGVYK